jgi:streptomycin 6-kinase
VTDERGPGWVWPPARKLDAIAAGIAHEWGIELGPRFPMARYSFAGPAGDGAVLKVAPVEDDEADFEADGLAAWGGDGAVRLLRFDRVRRALLIERCVPGDDASTIDDRDAIAIALEVGRRLWRPVAGGPFRTAAAEVARWLADTGRDGHPFAAIAQELFAKMPRRDGVLVHGDYHHHNLLRHGDRWVAIDPKPLIAEPEFDVVTLLWNPVDVFPTRERTERRIAAFAAAGLDERRVREWAIIRGTYLALPLGPTEDEATAPQLAVARMLLEP